MADKGNLEQRLAAVEDELAIKRLVAKYVCAIDDRDLATLAGLFTADARFRSADGAMNASGRETIVEFFEQRYTSLGPTNHVSHDHLIDFQGPDRARGQVSSHAEMWRDGRATLAAIRYADAYEKADGVWRFADRRLSFFYYFPLSDYSTALGQTDRIRYGAQTRPADYPEGLSTWKDYRTKTA